MTTFIVNGETRTLELRDERGIDWSADFIGNTYHGMESDEEGNYLATEEEFNWWRDMITQWEEMETVIAAYKEAHDHDEVQRVVDEEAGGCDLEDQPAHVINGLREAFGEL